MDADHPSAVRKKSRVLFRKELKKHKLGKADEARTDAPLMFKQEGARIVHAKCDEDLMGEVLADLKESFDKIAAMDAQLTSDRAAKLGRTVEKQPAVKQGGPVGSVLLRLGGSASGNRTLRKCGHELW